MNPSVSIIVPVYNVEKHLNRCLDSLVTQDYKNFEIILINDGSTDTSEKICLDYSKKFKNIKLVTQHNQGVSAARNTGIRNSSGEYITFVDSDDYVTTDYLSYLVLLLNKFNVLAAGCAHQNINPGSKEMDPTIGEEELLSDKEYFYRLGFNLLPSGFGVSVHSKIYHKDLFKKVEFPEGKLFEDSSESFKLLLESGNIALSSKVKYFYVRNEGSIVQGSFKASRLTFIDAEKEMTDGILSVYPDLKDPMRQRLNYAKMNTLAHAVRAKDKAFAQVEKDLRKQVLENYQFIMQSKTAPKRDKIGMFTLKLGLPAYKLMFDIYKFKQARENK